MGGEELVALDDGIKTHGGTEDPKKDFGERLDYAAGSQRIAPIVSKAPANS